MPARLKLLNEIRRDPPVFILRELGRCPVSSRKHGGEDLRLQWSRLVLRVIDYRAERGIDDPFHALGPAPVQREDIERIALQRELASFADSRHRRSSDRGLGR